MERLDAYAAPPSDERAISWSGDPDESPPDLACGALHEWFTTCESGDDGRAAPAFPPLSIFIALARRALIPERSALLWIGRACWPYPPALADLLPVSIFIDPPTDVERLWATDLALRCRAVGAVIADGQRFSMPATRRLQLAAAAGGTPCFLFRPSHELRELSAAKTRWRVSPHPASQDPSPPPSTPSWTVHLLRCKGMRPNAGAAHTWHARIDHETGALHLVPHVRV